ncbi:Serine protease 38 like protein [Argiope bruennichi]|nr:Serine protease 38 like protein [Argiope bruennichi]
MNIPYGTPLYRLREPYEMIVKMLPAGKGLGESNFTVSKIIPHPYYPIHGQFVPGMYDIALLQLSEEILCGISYPVPICLHRPGMQDALGKIFIAGFGRQNETQIEVPTLREGALIRSFDKERCKMMDFTMTMCLLESNQTVCHGDSGSSAFQKFGHFWYSVGVSSGRRGVRCDPLEPSYFTRTAMHFRWIQEHVKNLPMPHNNRFN